MPSKSKKIVNTSGDALLLYDDSEPGEIAQNKFVFNLSEDIWAVIIGSVLIAAVLIAALVSPGFKFEVPTYQWATRPHTQSQMDRVV